jgi:hypothetical protein
MAASEPEPQRTPFRESLALELKSWLNPDRDVHRAEIVRTLIALRNHGGGTLLLGVGDNGEILEPGPELDLAQRYQGDRIQDLVSRHASERFPVDTQIVEQDGCRYVRIDVAAGIRTPVRVAQSIAKEDGSKQILTKGDVLVRTLESNGRVSTAPCGADDWERLMQTCFDNRESDIARFIRRHLGSAAPALAELLKDLRGVPLPGEPDAAAALLDTGAEAFSTTISRHGGASRFEPMLGWGAREAALVIEPAPDGFQADGAFLMRLLSSAPRLTSYPPLLDAAIGGPASGFEVRQGRWEGLLSVRSPFDLLTFELAEPTGRFYERRLYLPDAIARANGEQPRFALGEREAITDVVEVILTGLAFASALRVADEEHSLHFAFRWSGLEGRLIDKWFVGSRASYVAAEAVSPACRLTISGDAPPTALASRISEAMRPMFQMFRGYMSPPQQVEETLREVIERRSRF